MIDQHVPILVADRATRHPLFRVRWRARRDHERGLYRLGDGQERLDGNPYVDGLKYACAGFAGLGLITFALRPELGLLLWCLAGVSLVGWLGAGALLWQPPSEQPPE
ncbi:hypothetical protein ABZV93_00910 [Actinopolymorpha sp. NPDC004070]|uniref:hypothetical protein n=1 Tax=Actinopolymorpha sp. NPDC004070 TaxID=3154548 RepID=UPI0033A1329C